MKTAFTGETSHGYLRYHHDVLLTGLAAGAAYSYSVGFSSHPHRSGFAFTTTSAAAARIPFTAAVVGDMGVNQSAGTLQRIAARRSSYNLTIHVGDVSYADDYDMKLIEPSSGTSYEAIYDLYQQLVEPIASSVPYMVTPGNHDVTCHSTGDLHCPPELRNFSAFRYRWRMPSPLGAAAATAADDGRRHNRNMWYSWRVSSVHFVSVSTESDFPHAPTTPHTFVGGGAGGGFGDQLGFLRQDLAAAAADPTVRWIVAIGHRPWYSSAKVDWPLTAPSRVQQAFEPLLREFGVDLWLCGHKHFYERTARAFKGKADPNGTVHIINGAAGNNEGVEKGHAAAKHDLVVASDYVSQGYGELSQLNATALRWRYISSADGSVVDEVML